MSRISEYVERVSKEWREQHFKEHVASQIKDILHPVVIINWQKDGTWIYGCRFIIHRRWLCVVGDIGEATYEWSQDLTLEFLAGLDFGYFAGKCRASEHGSKYESWDAHMAETCANDRIKELLVACEGEESEQSEGDKKEQEVLTAISDYDQDTFKAAAQEYYDEHGDAEGAGGIATMGMVPDGRCIGHFVGLQMAIAQLKAKSMV